MPSITYCKNVYNVVEMSAIVQISRNVLNTGMRNLKFCFLNSHLQRPFFVSSPSLLSSRVTF